MSALRITVICLVLANLFSSYDLLNIESVIGAGDDGPPVSTQGETITVPNG